jgi:RNA polymerase sigma-70 factor (sigma-E family)
MGGVVDDDEFAGFVRNRGQALTRTAYLLTGDAGRAEDLVQASLLKLWLRGQRVPRTAWESYVRRTIVNTSISWWRRRSSSERPTDVLPDTATDDATAAVADRQRLIAALRQLPARQRAAVVLRHYEDLSEADTALTLGCGVGTVKSLTWKGLRQLRDLIVFEEDAATGSAGEGRFNGPRAARNRHG